MNSEWDDNWQRERWIVKSSDREMGNRRER